MTQEKKVAAFSLLHRGKGRFGLSKTNFRRLGELWVRKTAVAPYLMLGTANKSARRSLRCYARALFAALTYVVSRPEAKRWQEGNGVILWEESDAARLYATPKDLYDRLPFAFPLSVKPIKQQAEIANAASHNVRRPLSPVGGKSISSSETGACTSAMYIQVPVKTTSV